MTRGVPKGQLTKNDLCERLGLQKNDPRSKLDLLRLASERKVISPKELDLSLPTNFSVIKCYLYSFLQSEECRQSLEDYVQIASQLYTRGSFIANLIASELFGNIETHETFPMFDFNSERFKDLFDFIEDSNDFKQCFLPERYPTSKATRHPFVEAALQKESLRRMEPNWRSLMNVSGWDNSINRMASKYHANVMNHVSVHLKGMINKYLKNIVIENEAEDRSNINNLFNRPVRPYVMSNTMFEFVIALREYLGCLDLSDYMFSSFDYGMKAFSLMMFMVKHGVTEGTYLPVSTLGRKYSYVDIKISEHLLPRLFKSKKRDNTKPSLMDLYGISTEDYRRRRKLLRQQLRRKYKGNSKKLRKKWMRLGYSNMPRDARVQSFETDGVGVSICIQRPVSLLPSKEVKEQPLQDPVFVGVDLGRAKLFTSAISTNGIQKPKTVLYTRRNYYRDMKHKHHRRFEIERGDQPDLKEVIGNLSQDGGKRNIDLYVQKVADNLEVLRNEYLVDKERALWKMRLFRLKKRALDKAVQKVLEACGKRDIVIGIGDSKIAPTGKGEKAMPTGRITKVFLKAKRSREHEQGSQKRPKIDQTIKFLSINEFRTTLCCCSCGCETQPFVKKDGTRSCRLRLCQQCNSEDGKVRDRDVQAARNMLWLTQHMYFGSERPWYMCRPKKATTS